MVWTTDAGDEMSADAGDWWVSDSSGGGRSVAGDRFTELYADAADGWYRRTGTVTATQVKVTVTIETLEGPAQARRDDWIVDDGLGRWPVPDTHFRQGYEVVQ